MRTKDEQQKDYPDRNTDRGHTGHFHKSANKSAILNWLITGYWLIQEVGFDPTQRVNQAVAEYRQEADVIGVFLAEYTIAEEKSHLSTPVLYSHYSAWAKDNGYKALNNKNFVGELRKRCDVRKDSHSNVIVGLALSFDSGLPA